MSHKVRRIERLRDAYFKLQGRYEIPGNVWAFEGVEKQEYVCTTLPENCDIENAIHTAFKKAVDIAVKLQLTKQKIVKIPTASLPFTAANSNDNREDAEDSHDEEDDELIDIEADGVLELPDDDHSDETDDVVEDLVVSTGPIGLKTFSNVSITVTSPFVEVRDGSGKDVIIRKSSYIWLLCSGDSTLSSDRLQRVKCTEVQRLGSKNNFKGIDVPSIEEVAVGSWCAFLSEDSSTIVGRILSFSYLNGASWKQQEYSGLKAAVDNNTNRRIGCMCSWFHIGKKGFLDEVAIDSHGYYDLENYICPLPRPLTSNKKLKLACSLKSINDLKL